MPFKRKNLQDMWWCRSVCFAMQNQDSQTKSDKKLKEKGKVRYM